MGLAPPCSPQLELPSCSSYQTGMVRQALFLLAEHLNCYAYSIAFPEMVIPTVMALRKVSKTSKVLSFQKQAKRLLSQIEIQVLCASKRHATRT